MKNKLIISLLVIIILSIIIVDNVVNFGIKMILMSDRKDSITMVGELRNNFGVDYRDYLDLPVEDVIIISEDGLKLKGYYHEVNKESNKVVIINHGYTANHYVTYQYTDMFFEEGYNALLVDMRSHGESEGEVASYGYNESKDIGRWVEWVKNKIGQDAYIGLHGQSMGAATVMLYGGQNPDDIQFVIEDCGFTTAREAIEFQFVQAKIPFWPLYNLIENRVNSKYKFDLNEVSPIESITNSDVPTLFIHGNDDDVVPSWMVLELYNKKKGAKDMIYTVEGAGHMESLSNNRQKYEEIVKEFLNNLQ